MSTPDRFDKALNKVRRYRPESTMVETNGIYHLSSFSLWYRREDIVKLLRREHAAVKRMVRALRKAAKARTEYQADRGTRGKVISSYTLACDDILDKLARRGK